MPRIMGDATHTAAAALAAVPGLQLAAGYVTGTPDIQWTAADWELFPGIPHVTIDQASDGSPVPAATVRDVEPGAWPAASAVASGPWTAARPTIYCDRADLPGVLAAGWQGDLWLAVPGWQPGSQLPAAPGCTVVAVQATYGPAYDLSYVLDPAWPSSPATTREETMMIIWAISGNAYLLSGGRAHHITSPEALALYTAAQPPIPVAGAPSPAPDTQRIDAAEEAALLADFPAGDPAVTISGGTFTVTPG